MQEPVPYPARGVERDQWILQRRTARNRVDSARPYASFVEPERTESGEMASTATIFLANRECPWKCVFCDLWKNTVTATPPLGAVPAQLDDALARLRPARQVKLYNNGSFFDPRAIPAEDRSAIAKRVSTFERVIVECHPALVGRAVLAFRDLLKGTLEVAMGLETAHPAALEKLNKHITIDQFARAASFLARHGIALRVFVLVHAPFVPRQEASLWLRRSIDLALECGATVCSLIPTRAGNGALDELLSTGDFWEPSLADLEEAAEYGIDLRRGRVFADLWDLDRFASCPQCYPGRLERLKTMNDMQTVPKPVRCERCGGR